VASRDLFLLDPEVVVPLDPPIAGRGCRETAFSLRNGPQGTSDPSAYLAVPAALEFVREHGDAPVSIAPYNGADAVEALVGALQELFKPLCM
jgi:hypothetical protein